MRTSNASTGTTFDGSAHFQTTHWSAVLAAGQEIHLQSAAALERLCRIYWFPIYSYLRRQNHPHHDAQDLTQSFFEHLLTHCGLRTVHPDKGKFRSFLLASLKNFVANERGKSGALKRGGQFSFVSLDEALSEQRFQREAFRETTPDKAFERSWAMSLLDLVFDQLKTEYVAEGKADYFAGLQIYLSGDKGLVSYAEMASRLQITEAALKMAVLRMRRRFGALLRSEIGRTVAATEEIDEEIRYLFAAVKAE